MAEERRISDEVLIVRGGRNRSGDIERGTATHPSGVTGVSMHAAEGLTTGELAQTIPHGQVGVTTVAEVRAIGGDVVRTSEWSPHHATLRGLTPEQASNLLTLTTRNPAQQEPKPKDDDG